MFTLKSTYSAAHLPTYLQIQPVYGLRRILESFERLQAVSWATLRGGPVERSQALQSDWDRQKLELPVPSTAF